MSLTLSGIQNFSTDYLTEGANYLKGQADQAESVFRSAHTSVDSSTWQGQSSQDARSHYAGDLAAVTAHATQLRATAQTMTSEAEALANARNEVMAEVSTTQQEGFTVGEDFSVSDTTSPTPEAAFFREPIAKAHAATLAARVTAFTAAEQKAVATLTGHTAELSAGPGFKPLSGGRGWCPPEQMPGDCIDKPPWYGTTVFPGPHGDDWGGEGYFNPKIQIDKSHATSTGREDLINGGVGSSVKPDWPVTGAGSDTQPFLPRWQQEITNPSVPPQPPLTVQTPNGPMYLLPPARDFPGFGPASANGGPASLRPTGGNVSMVDYHTWAQDPSPPSPSPNPWTGPGGVWTPMDPAAGDIGPPPPLPDPTTEELQNLQNRISVLEHPDCTGETLAVRSVGLLSATVGTGVAAFFVPESGPIGLLGVAAGAGAMGASGDMLWQCLR